MDIAQTLGVKAAVITLIVLLVLVFVAQLIVGVFGTASSVVNGTLVNASFFSALAHTASANAMNDTAANSLVVTLSGSYSWISSSNPLTIQITGNQISTFASNTAYAVPGNSQTKTFKLTSATATQTLSATAGNFYNISNIALSGFPGTAYPSINASIVQGYISATHGSAPAAYSTNSITGLGSAAITLGQAAKQYASTGTANTTVINFIPIVVLVALIIIILGLFGLKNLLNVGSEAGEGGAI